MILQYSKILQYHWLSKVKQQFMAYWQQQFYDPNFAFAATKHTAQWRNMTTEMTTEIMTETKTETTTAMPLPDQYPIVQSSIRSQCLSHASVSWRRIGRRWWRCSGIDALGMYVLDYNVCYIYPIKTILKMCHKLLYMKIGVLGLWCWKMEKKSSWINNKID